MKAYKWNSSILQKKNKTYNTIALSSMIVSLVFAAMLGNFTVAIVFLGVAFIGMLMSWKLQGQDKKLKTKH